MPTTTRRAGMAAGVRGVCLLGTALVLFSGGVVRAQDASPIPAAMPAADESGGPLLIGAGDLLDVQVLDTQDLSGRLRVDQRGFANLPLGGSVDVRGLNAEQCANAIADRLRSAGIMLDPHVTVFVTEFVSSVVTVQGEVKSPARLTLYGPQSLYDVLARVGGLTLTAGQTLKITRVSDPSHPITVQIGSPDLETVERTIFINPGDTVDVSREGMYYVIGDVTRPGGFPIQHGQPVSLLNAIALSGGVLNTAKFGKAIVIRKTPQGTETISLDLKGVQKNQGNNLILQASDVLVIPHSAIKAFIYSTLPTVGQTGISLGISEAIVR